MTTTKHDHITRHTGVVTVPPAPKPSFSEAELRTIVFALEAAAHDAYEPAAKTADEFQPRIAEQFRTQRAEALRLAEKITEVIG